MLVNIILSYVFKIVALFFNNVQTLEKSNNFILIEKNAEKIRFQPDLVRD